jgi:hypothetical protein
MKIIFAGLPGAPEQTEYKLDGLPRLFSLFELLSFSNGGRAIRVWREKWKEKKNKIKKWNYSLTLGHIPQKLKE